MNFRLVPKSVTLNYLERRNGRYIALFHWICWTCVPTHNRVLTNPSVRPSVCLTKEWTVAKRKKLLPTFLYHTKDLLCIWFCDTNNCWWGSLHALTIIHQCWHAVVVGRYASVADRVWLVHSHCTVEVPQTSDSCASKHVPPLGWGDRWP